MYDQKKIAIFRNYKFLLNKIFPLNSQRLLEKCIRKFYFLYLDYVRGRSLDIKTNKIYPPFTSNEVQELQKIQFYLSPAAKYLLDQSIK